MAIKIRKKKKDENETNNHFVLQSFREQYFQLRKGGFSA